MQGDKDSLEQPDLPSGGGQDVHYDSHVNAPVNDPTARFVSEDRRSMIEVAPDAVDDAIITWEASEYIHHQKDTNWYMIFSVALVVVAVIMFFLTGRDWITLIVILVMGGAFGKYAGRKPQVQRYSLSFDGVSVGNKHYDYDDFHSFSVEQEGTVFCITFMPTKRFMPPLSIYASPEDGQKIIDTLESTLPHEEPKHDIVDRLTRNIRF